MMLSILVANCLIAPSMKNSDIDALVKQVDAVRLKSTVTKLASWPNRNTNNPTLTEAAEWIASQYAAIPGLKVEIMRYKVEKSSRIPEAKEVVQKVADKVKGAVKKAIG